MKRKRAVGTKKNRRKVYMDLNLLFIVIFLLCFGFVMLYSSSSFVAAAKYNGDSAYFLKKQVFSTVIGLVGMTTVTLIDYRIWKKFATAGYLLALSLSVLVLIIGSASNGSTRWIRLGPLSFQPSELVKIVSIIFIATLICEAPQQLSNMKTIIGILIVMAPMIGLVAYTNLSTAVIIIAIVFLLMYSSSQKTSPYLLLGTVGAGLMGGLGLVLFKYRMERIEVWLDPESSSKGFQTLQALYAIGSGKIFGKGLGESIQKLGFIPEAQNDMIFSIICEELGLFGAFCLIALFCLLLYRIYTVSKFSKDLFGKLVSLGVMIHIAMQVMLNIAVVTNTIPNTGITLPFISYGGTSICFLLAEIGLVLSVSRNTLREKN